MPALPARRIPRRRPLAGKRDSPAPRQPAPAVQRYREMAARVLTGAPACAILYVSGSGTGPAFRRTEQKKCRRALRVGPGGVE
jgi:hypothetical protein